MKKYIDAEAFLKSEITRCRCVPLVGSGSDDYKNLQELLEEAPTADVAEVRHGWWIDGDFPEKKVTANSVAICSVCQEVALKTEHGYSILSHFCPNCGAKMDGGNKR